MKRRIIGLLFGAGVLALVVAGVVAFAPHGHAEPVSATPALEQIETDERTVEVSWIDRDGNTGVETYTITLSDASDGAATEPSPPDAGDQNE